MRTIVLIEDDSVTRLSIGAFLRAQNFHVLEARDGAIGLQLTQEHRPDLVLCDINLPELDGYEVLQELRKDVMTEKTPFLFISSECCCSNYRRARELGANDYLRKPVVNHKLLEAITIQLDKHISD